MIIKQPGRPVLRFDLDVVKSLRMAMQQHDNMFKDVSMQTACGS